MTILRFLARRLVYSLVVLVGVLIVVFALGAYRLWQSGL